MTTRKFSQFTNGTSQTPSCFLVGYNPAFAASAQNSRWTLNDLFAYPASRNVGDQSFRWTTQSITPAISAAGEASLYFNGITLQISYNGGAYASLNVAGNPAGLGTELQYRDGAVFGAVANSAVSGASIGLGGGVAASALLALTSTSQGFLPPRMTTTERDAISSPAHGLQILNTTTGAGNIRSRDATGNTSWQAMLTDYYYVQNPLVANNDTNFRPAIYWRIDTDGKTTNPNFSTHTGLSILYTPVNGQNDPGGAAKKTFQVFATTINAAAAGQRFAVAHTINGYGMGDLIGEDRTMNAYCGVSAGGDEGTKWARYALTEGTSIVRSTIVAVTAATINTTITQTITKSINAQTVTVGDSTGVAVGQWVVIDGGAPSTAGYNAAEAVQVTAVAAGTISGVFVRNHNSGVTVLPAIVLVLSSGSMLGQDRYLVNHSATSYTTGTAKGTATGNPNITGSGTTWAASMIGGDANNSGLISFEADDYTSAPFSGGTGTLRAWYPIALVISATSLNIYRRDQVGLAGYSGNATTFGNYAIRPGARILSVSGSTVVLDANLFIWTVADTVECVQSSSADVSGATWDMAWYMPGQTLREGLNIRNSGARDFQTGLLIATYGAATGGWLTGIAAVGKTTGLIISSLSTTTGNAIQLNTLNEIYPQRIQWLNGGSGPSLEYSSTNRGLFIDTIGQNIAPLNFKSSSAASDTMSRAEYTGHFQLKNFNNALQPRLRIEGLSSRAYEFQAGGSSTNQLIARATTDSVTYKDIWDYSLSGLDVLASGTATNGANKNSLYQSFTASIWDGAAAAAKFWFARLDAASNSANADQQWSIWRPSTNTAFPTRVLLVDTNGKLGFGTTATGGVGTTKAAVFDPTGITAGQTRNYTCPDRNGVLALTDMQQKASDPTTSDIAANTWAVYKNTASGAVALWANDGGTMKSVALI